MDWDGEHRGGQADRRQHLELPLRRAARRQDHRRLESSASPARTRRLAAVRCPVSAGGTAGLALVGGLGHAGQMTKTDSGDRRHGQHRHRPDVQAAPVRRDRPAVHGRHRSGRAKAWRSLASTASRRSARASTGCSSTAIDPTSCSRRRRRTPTSGTHHGSRGRHPRRRPHAGGDRPVRDPRRQPHRAPRRDERQHGHLRRPGDHPDGVRRLP